MNRGQFPLRASTPLPLRASSSTRWRFISRPSRWRTVHTPASTEKSSMNPSDTSSKSEPAEPPASPPAQSAASAEDKSLSDEAEEATRKWGLEAGLWKSFRQGGAEGKTTAKDLLKRYGSAYLITSISLSLVSFTLFYLLVSNGIDVPELLAKVGIKTGDTGQNIGTVALAYAAHKAASPIRFPPTVALTPVVANWLKSLRGDGGGDN